MSQKSNYVKLGAMVLDKEKDSEGRPKYYFKLDKDVKILVNGKELASNSFQIERPTDKYDRMVAAGKISEKEHAEKIAMYDEDGKAAFVKFEFTAKVK
jgi:hypothetical protein